VRDAEVINADWFARTQRPRYPAIWMTTTSSAGNTTGRWLILEVPRRKDERTDPLHRGGKHGNAPSIAVAGSRFYRAARGQQQAGLKMRNAICSPLF
jgi:hypothetical protein